MKKILCALLASSFVFAGVISGCSMGGNQASTQNSNSGSSQSSAQSSDAGESSNADESSADTQSGDAMAKKPKAELISTLSADDMSSINNFESTDMSMFYYTGSSKYAEDAKFGIINTDTGKIENAEYSFLEEAKYDNKDNTQKRYYAATKSKSQKTVSEMNSFGLVSTTGEELVPFKYASLEVLNDKYVKVITITGETADKGSALVYKNPDSNSFSIGMSDDATLYKGKWQIYDIEKKALVSGVEGTTAESISASGSVIRVGTEKYYGETGDQLDNIDKLFDNGCYTVESGGITHVNDTNGKKLFQFDNKAVYLTDAFDDNTFVEHVDDKYYIVDGSGNKISADFDKAPEKNGSYYFTYTDELYNMYDIDGKQVYNGSIKSYRYNKLSKTYRITDKDEGITFLDENAKVIGSHAKTDKGDYYEGVSYESSGDDYAVYSFADKSYSIKSKDYPKTCFIFSFSNGSGVISTINNSAIIEENYSSFNTNGNGLVLAKKLDGSADLYKISMA